MTHPLKSPPTEEQILEAFEGTDFGPHDPIPLLKTSLLKVCCGYWNGHTMTCILERLGLIRTKYRSGESTVLVTDLGRRSCYAWFALKTSKKAGAVDVD